MLSHRESEDDLWGRARGSHRYGEVSDAGEEFLGFLNSNQATACNTWFQKKGIHLATWQHPRSKSWFYIDYVGMRERDRWMCLDAAVKRGAEYHTDHQLLCAGLRMTWKLPRSSRRSTMEWLIAAGLRRNCGLEGSDRSSRQKYVAAVLERAGMEWPEGGRAEEKWGVMRMALADMAEELLGRASRRQPDWFLESEDIIFPFLQARNKAYTRWLASSDR